jgi:DNA repair exonuclease SbcCD nuclease subunit
MSILFVGDIHIRLENFEEIDKLQLILKDIVTNDKSIEYIVFGGDILHTHEKLHTLALNKATSFLTMFKEFCKVICIVGNHDMINNQQFLTENHWMNSLKDTITIVDKPMTFTGDINFGCVPYVYNGKFKEALSYIKYKEMDILFCHQEFKGCKMGAIISEHGDEWDKEDIPIISGHIHDYQKPQENIFYPGTPIQHSFGDRNENIVVKITKGEKINYEEIPMNIEKKKIVYVDIEKVKDLTIKTENPHNVKITINGSVEELKALKKTAKFKELVDQGFKIATKTKKEIGEEEKKEYTTTDFHKLLFEIVEKETNKFIIEDYKKIFGL